MVFGVVKSVDNNGCDHGKQNSEADGSKCQVILPGVESIYRLESVWVCSKESEKDRESESRVQAQQENDWLCEQHV